jgi:DNA end-binding protein Ku
MARSIWTGSLSFGLVSIPVRVVSATRDHDVRFHQLAPDGSRIHLERVSEKSGRKIEFKNIKKGYETSKGKWVVIEPEDLEQLAPKTTKTIDIEDFVALPDIDPIYFERTYCLVPQNDAAAKAYALLADVMEDKQLIGIGKVVMREKQYLAAIRPYGKGLAMSTMRFADEVLAPSQIDGMPARKASVNPREKKMAAQIVDALASEWDPKRYHDDYEEQVQALLKAKAKGKQIEMPEVEESAKVLDLTEALRASLESGSRKSTRSRPRAKAKQTTSKRTAKHSSKRAPAKRRSA